MYSAIGRTILIVPHLLLGFGSLSPLHGPCRYLFTVIWCRRIYQISKDSSCAARKRFTPFFSSFIKICHGSADLFRLDKI